MPSDYASRARLYREALDDALAGASTEGSGDSLNTLAALVSRCRAVETDDSIAQGALDAFDAILERGDVDVGIAEATSLFASPQRFREALFFLRCLDREAASALTLMHRQAYLSGAVAPVATHPDLARDQAALLEATTFETLWQEPSRLAWMEDAIRKWRRAYVPAYTAQHAEYNLHVAAVAGDIEAAQWQSDALHKLNRLERLGDPVAQPALSQFHALEALFACPSDAEQLAADLDSTPVCPSCGFRLGDVAPVEALNNVLIALDRGLETQQSRLAQRVVTRLLSRPGRPQEDRLNRFIRVVQASDPAGLARVLDEGLLEFLGDVLATPELRINLIDRLALQFPEITADSLEAAVDAFRALVMDEIEQGYGRVVIGREDGA